MRRDEEGKKVRAVQDTSIVVRTTVVIGFWVFLVRTSDRDRMAVWLRTAC
jgi:hypothetical protein